MQFGYSVSFTNSGIEILSPQNGYFQLEGIISDNVNLSAFNKVIINLTSLVHGNQGYDVAICNKDYIRTTSSGFDESSVYKHNRLCGTNVSGSYVIEFDIRDLTVSEKANVAVAILSVGGATGPEKIRVTKVYATK